MLDIVQTITHYGLHLFAPGLLAFVFFRSVFVKAWIIMLLTLLVDLDHLFATPIFDPNRCSIGFHPLHSYPAIGLYVLLLFVPHRYTKIVGVGLLLHMVAGFQDCLWILGQ